MTPDLPGWSDLPFWHADWPRIRAALAAGSGPVLPPGEMRFRALALCPPDRVRAVILGQDPYHTPGKADGLAFSIAPGFAGNLASLGNILRELQDDLGIRRTDTDLSGWARQGVLLLNTALSVPAGQPGGHAALGWDRLVAQVLARLDRGPRAFLLWGAQAQALRRHLTRADHLVIATAHPSPLSARRGFLGSRPFSAVNRWLVAQGAAPIDWAA
ncbi:MAG: uracil-DNA glycosylase [Rubellimicrobium sp.]|nr:uracil-DNA glycosylase [Rubellimicrobium sp.]